MAQPHCPMLAPDRQVLTQRVQAAVLLEVRFLGGKSHTSPTIPKVACLQGEKPSLQRAITGMPEISFSSSYSVCLTLTVSARLHIYIPATLLCLLVKPCQVLSLDVPKLDWVCNNACQATNEAAAWHTNLTDNILGCPETVQALSDACHYRLTVVSLHQLLSCICLQPHAFSRGTSCKLYV